MTYFGLSAERDYAIIWPQIGAWCDLKSSGKANSSQSHEIADKWYCVPSGLAYTGPGAKGWKEEFLLALGICVSCSLNLRSRVSGVLIPRRYTVSIGEIESVAAITFWVPPASGIVRVSYPDHHRELRLLLYTDVQT